MSHLLWPRHYAHVSDQSELAAPYQHIVEGIPPPFTMSPCCSFSEHPFTFTPTRRHGSNGNDRHKQQYDAAPGRHSCKNYFSYCSVGRGFLRYLFGWFRSSLYLYCAMPLCVGSASRSDASSVYWIQQHHSEHRIIAKLRLHSIDRSTNQMSKENCHIRCVAMCSTKILTWNAVQCETYRGQRQFQAAAASGGA